MGEASTTGPRAESRVPAGSELQPAALGLVLDPFLIVRSAVRSAEQHPESTGSERPGPEVLK